MAIKVSSKLISISSNKDKEEDMITPREDNTKYGEGRSGGGDQDRSLLDRG